MPPASATIWRSCDRRSRPTLGENRPALHTRLQLPQGASCFTFEEARRRRAIEARVVSVFEGWGYDEIVPPLFDDATTFDPAVAEAKLWEGMSCGQGGESGAERRVSRKGTDRSR